MVYVRRPLSPASMSARKRMSIWTALGCCYCFACLLLPCPKPVVASAQLQPLVARQMGGTDRRATQPGDLLGPYISAEFKSAYCNIVLSGVFAPVRPIVTFKSGSGPVDRMGILVDRTGCALKGRCRYNRFR
jgi:hypothetical protein